MTDVYQKACDLFAAGMKAAEVARQLGKSASTVREWRERWRQHKPANVKPEDVKEMELSALRQKVKDLERVKVECEYKPNIELTDPEQKWKRAEVENAEAIRRVMQISQFSVTLPSEPCAIPFISDQHISIGNCVDLTQMRQDAELIANTDNCYPVLGGDGPDNHIKHRAAVMASRSQPGDQWELYEWYLSLLGPKLLVLISGNHCAWTDQIAGIDMVKRIADAQRLCYAPDEALISIKVGEQPYKIGIRHQYRMNSSFNETHAVKQWFRNGEYDWDIGCIGHNHVSAIEPFWGHGIERWAARPGSYQITSAYSRQFGYNKTTPRCPTFVLFPDKRHIVGFHRLEDGLTYLKAVRGK